MRKKYSKYENDAILVRTKIAKIEYLNQPSGERVKSVFYIKSKDGSDVMCVAWGHKNLNVGDEIEMQGRLNDAKIFLIWSMLIHKRAEKNEV